MNLRRFAVGIPLLAAALLFPACSPPAAPEPDVIVLHSGRLRGNVYPLSLRGISPLQHYQYLAGNIRQVRETAKKSGARVFVVDLGDSLGGSFASHVTGSQNMVTFFNETGYDAVMLSNLDGEVPAEALGALRAKILNPFVGPDGLPAAENSQPGARWDLDGVPVYLLANFYGDADPAALPGRFPEQFGRLTEGVRPVRDYTAVLKALGERPAGALVLFGWMKFEPTATTPEAFLTSLRDNRVDAILAHRIYGSNEREAWQASGFVDWRPPVSLNILRNNGGFVLARMDLARDGAGWKVLSHELVPMTANSATADSKVVAAVETFAPAIQAADAPVAKLPEPLDAAGILSIYLRALSTVPGTTAVAYSADSIRSDWPAGELRASTVFNSLPWTSGLVQITIERTKLADFPAVARLQVLVSPEAGDGPVVVTTSRFFASLLERQIGLPRDSFKAVPQSSEFDFFTAYLKSHPDSLPGLHGWETVSGP